MGDLALKINEVISDSEGAFASTIAQYKWELIPNSQLQAAKQALTKSDYIMKIACGDVDAVHDALIKAAILGLDLTEGKRQGWLLPRKNQQGKTIINLQVGYKGVEAIHQRMGVIDRLAIRVVRENDTFDWSGDDQEKPKHEADWFGSEDSRGKITGAFAITYYPDRSINVTTAPVTEIFEKHRDISDSWKSYQSKIANGQSAYPPPWASFEKAMIEKTMAYIASKQWPANIRNQETSSRILETLHEVDTEDYSTFKNKYSQEEKQAFDELIENTDQLGLFLFNQYVDFDVSLALFSSFPKGHKVKMKAKANEMSKIGAELFSGALHAIKTHDLGEFFDNTDGCSELTMKLLRNRSEDREGFDEMRKKLAENSE